LAINLPNNWQPRDYQLPAWAYLENGGTHAELIWHRRSGKDDICLNWAGVAAFQRVATYWHMLPEAAQARKAIWEAINPHTGIRRIDEAFPKELRATTREQEMMIKFINGSTWQVVGSDNYNSLVGSPPAGVVYSEWALAKPSARAYLRPILAENGGWQVFITTPRGKNHAFKTYEAGRRDSNCFAQRLSAEDTSVFSSDVLASERQAYIDEFGEDLGEALFRQEYLVSFDAAIMGAFYANELDWLDRENRIRPVEIESRPVHAAFDIGKTDDTSIWFFQSSIDGLRIPDFHTSSGKEVEFYIDLLRNKDFEIGILYLPHDAKAKRLGMRRTVEEQFRDAGFKVAILPNQSIQDGIQAARKTFKQCYIDPRCDEGIEALRQYRREWDQDKKCFRNTPVHDWTSHPADAFRYLAQAWTEVKPEKPKETKMTTINDVTINDLWKTAPSRQRI
jgi:phage terminase large subunit